MQPPSVDVDQLASERDPTNRTKRPFLGEPAHHLDEGAMSGAGRLVGTVMLVRAAANYPVVISNLYEPISSGRRGGVITAGRWMPGSG